MSSKHLHDTRLMWMSGARDGRNWMEVDPDAPKPSLTAVLWLFVLIFAGVGFVALVAGWN